MRNPKADGWPRRGAQTEDEDIARKWAWDYLAYYRDGTRRELLGTGPRPRPLQSATIDFLEHRAVTVEPNTLASDRTAMAHLCEYFGDTAKTTDTTPERMQKMVDTRLRAGYAIGSIRTLLASVSPFFKYLGIPTPTKGIVLPDREAPEVHAWTDVELEALRDGADYVTKNYRERDWPSPRLVLEFFLASGLRQQEGYAAEWRRINADDNNIRVAYQLDRTTNELRVLKGKLARTVLLLPEFFDGFYDAEATGYVLGKPNGEPLGYRSQVNLLTRILDAARLKRPGIGYHSMRHTYARLFLERGGSLEQLREMMGHKSIRTTEQDYGHFKSHVASRLARQAIYGTRLRAV